jgi:hypothetical protein
MNILKILICLGCFTFGYATVSTNISITEPEAIEVLVEEMLLEMAFVQKQYDIRIQHRCLQTRHMSGGMII